MKHTRYVIFTTYCYSEYSYRTVNNEYLIKSIVCTDVNRYTRINLSTKARQMYLVPQMSVLKWLGNSSGFKVNINYYDKFFLYASMLSGLSTTVLNILFLAQTQK